MTRIVLLVLPLVALVGLIAVFALNIDRDPSFVQSVLIDKPAPEFSLAPVEGIDVPGLDTASLTGEVTVVNVFASWCIHCRDEHPLLVALKEQTGARLVGITQMDAPENARAVLAELGTPYDAIGADTTGRASIDWGVYGVPETFVIDRDGRIAFKLVGSISPQNLEQALKPQIEKALAAPRS